MSSPQLITFATEYRPPLGQLERYGSLLAALRASGGRYAALLCHPHRITGLATAHLAGLASLGFISEALFGIEELLAGAEYEIDAAINTPENPVPVLHIEPPFKANMRPLR
jgi:hypothetical protein